MHHGNFSILFDGCGKSISIESVKSNTHSDAVRRDDSIAILPVRSKVTVAFTVPEASRRVIYHVPMRSSPGKALVPERQRSMLRI